MISIPDLKRAITFSPTMPLPRRAVITEDGLVCEKVTRKTLVEVHALSRVCELVASKEGQQLPSRDCVELLRQCLDISSPKLWEAFLNDVETGDVDWPRMEAVFDAQPSSAALLTRCLIGARNGDHLAMMSEAVLRIDKNALRGLAKTQFGTSAHHQLEELARVYSEKGALQPRQLRSELLDALGRIMFRTVTLPQYSLLRELADKILGRPYALLPDLMVLFIHVPDLGPLLQLDPDLPNKVVLRASVLDPTLRGPFIGVLSRVAHEHPHHLAQDVRSAASALMMETMVAQCKMGRLEPKTSLAASLFWKIVGGSVDISEVAETLKHLFSYACTANNSTTIYGP